MCLIPGYLIAQLGKNYAIPKNQQINGRLLVEFAQSVVRNTQYQVGGVVEFLEYADSPFLANFYTEQGFRSCGTRISSTPSLDQARCLNQLYRVI
jgi:hypothetical protein